MLTITLENMQDKPIERDNKEVLSAAGKGGVGAEEFTLVIEWVRKKITKTIFFCPEEK